MQSYGLQDTTKVAFIEINGDRVATFNINAHAIYACAIVTPDCQLLEDVSTLPEDSSTGFNLLTTNNLAEFLNTQINKALAVEGYVACMSVNGRGDVDALTETTTTLKSEFEAILDIYNLNHTASDSESPDVIGNAGTSKDETWMFVINTANPDLSKNKQIGDGYGPRVVEYEFIVDG